MLYYGAEGASAWRASPQSSTNATTLATWKKSDATRYSTVTTAHHA